MGLIYTATNEGVEGITSDEGEIPPNVIEELLKPTKRKGRGKALKTILLEKEEEEKTNSSKTKDPQSSSDDDSPKEGKKGSSAE